MSNRMIKLPYGLEGVGRTGINAAPFTPRPCAMRRGLIFDKKHDMIITIQ